MSTASFDLVIAIARPSAEVFAVLADIRDLAGSEGSPVREMVKEPLGATGVGTTWREVVRVAPGTTMTVRSEVTAIEPDRRLAMRFRGPWFTGELAYEIEPDATGGCSLRQRERFAAPGPFGRLGGAMLRPRLVARLGALRAFLEHQDLA